MENRLEVSRGTRFLAALVSLVVAMLLNVVLSFVKLGFAGIIIITIVQIVLFVTQKTSIGGAIMGYKFVCREDESASLPLLKMFIFTILCGILQGITFGIFWIVDVATLSSVSKDGVNKNGMYWEKWSGVKKVPTK